MAPTHHPPELASLDAAHVWHPFTQQQTADPPLPVTHGRGAKLIGEDGREYLDLISSWWVNLHGHAHPWISDAVAEQARTLEQVMFAGFTHDPAARLAARLAALLPGDLDRVFYSDDGSTAVEVALKIAVQYWANHGERRNRFIAFDGGYHGDTVGAMSTGRSSGFFEPFAPLLFDVDVVPFPATCMGDDQRAEREAGSLQALEAALASAGDEVAGVIIEPLVQGAGGMRMCRPEFLADAAALVREHGALLILDEVMTGFGRLGPLFGCLKASITPDLVCLSKGLTGGYLPLSATVCGERLYQAFLGNDLDRAFLHGHSFTANPIACRAALASLDLLLQPECAARREAIEQAHRRKLHELRAHPRARRPRVHGTIAAIDFDVADAGYRSDAGPRLKRYFLEHGLVIRPLGNVIYLLPPYCVTPEEIEHAWDHVALALDEL